MTVAAGATGKAAITQTGIELQISIRDMRTGKTICHGDAVIDIFAGKLNGMDESVLCRCRGLQLNVVAVCSTDLAKGGYIGTNNAAVMKHCFHYRESKAFDDGGGQKQLTVPVAPLQPCI